MTFTALAKIYSTKYFCNAKVAGLGKIFVNRDRCVQNHPRNEYTSFNQEAMHGSSYIEVPLKCDIRGTSFSQLGLYVVPAVPRGL